MSDGLPVAVTWGPGEEDMVRRLARTAGDGVRQMPTNLEELVALCERAKLFVGGDTGPMHFAAAVGTPIVSIFGPTSSDRNGPFRSEDIVVERRLPCRPCYERDKCPLEHLAVHGGYHGGTCLRSLPEEAGTARGKGVRGKCEMRIANREFAGPVISQFAFRIRISP